MAAQYVISRRIANKLECLYYFDGLSYDQISERTGVKPLIINHFITNPSNFRIVEEGIWKSNQVMQRR